MTNSFDKSFSHDNIERKSGEGTEGVLALVELENLYKMFQEKGGHRLLATLVEANVVLTIAGARPQTEIFIKDPTSEDRNNISALQGVGDGIDITASSGLVTAAHGAKMLEVNVYNLKSYERLSRQIPFDGVPPYDASTGRKGLHEWTRGLYRAINGAKAQNKIPAECTTADVARGIFKGYPLTAVIDSTRENVSKLEKARIPSVSIYGGARPDFNYGPEHRDNPDIVRTIALWESILQEFYNGAWHRAIAKDPAFIAARNKMN